MGYRHRREDMLDAVVRIVRSEGVTNLSFARVAKELGTNDRTVVYYFPTKAELIGAVLTAMGAELQELLAEAFGEQPLAPADLGRRAWPVLARPGTRPVFAVFFEMLGQAAVGTAPYAELAPALIGQWLIWLEPRIDTPDPQHRRAAALALLAQLDGLLLLRLAAGPQAADDAARQLGFTDVRR